ncbi:MAG: ribonuclease E/G, partial [Microcystis panniformis]
SVEMTPVEQEVYSLMGISPLILVDKEFKDPKSVIVSVKLAGEREAENPEMPAATPEISLTPTLEVEDTAAPAPIEAMETGEEAENRPLVRRRRRPTTSEVSQEINQEASAPVTFTTEPIAPETPVFLGEVIPLETPVSAEVTEEPQVEAETAVLRRRRRRSSATVDES